MILCFCCGTYYSTTTCLRCACSTFCGTCGAKVSCSCGARHAHTSERCDPNAQPFLAHPSVTTGTGGA